MPKRIVITGMGIVSPVGIGKEAFWSNLSRGRSGIRPITLFDTANLSCKTAGEVADFEARDIMPGLKVSSLDRTAQLICAAVKLGIEDAGLELTEATGAQVGVIIGNQMATIHGCCRFDCAVLSDGYIAASPIDFTNTIPVTPAGHASILFGLTGFNGLLSSGVASSLDAIHLGSTFINLDRANVVVAGGGEALFLENFLHFYLPGRLSGSRPGEPELCAPFDRRRNGMVLGEASAMIVLEAYDHAVNRGAKIYAEILGFGTIFDPQVDHTPDSTVKCLTKAMTLALKRAGLPPSAIGLVCASANSSVRDDRAEALALKQTFAAGPERPAVTAIKSMTGECLGASGALQVSAAALALNEGMIPPIINYRDADPDCDLPLSCQSRERSTAAAMINAFGQGGAAASLVIGSVPALRRPA